MEKKDLLKDVIKHIDIKSYNSTELVDAMRNMSFTSRDTARAADILMMMCKEKECTNILTLAGSTSAAGCMQVYVDMVRNKMIDVVVATGASIIDMDLFEALGFKHYIGEKESFQIQHYATFISTVFMTHISMKKNFKPATTLLLKSQTCSKLVLTHHANLSMRSESGYTKVTLLRKIA